MEIFYFQIQLINNKLLKILDYQQKCVSFIILLKISNIFII